MLQCDHADIQHVNISRWDVYTFSDINSLTVIEHKDKYCEKQTLVYMVEHGIYQTRGTG